MKVLLIWYPKCSTCQKAKKWLEEHKVIYEERHILEECPTREELKQWINESRISNKKVF